MSIRTMRQGVEQIWFRVVLGDPFLEADAFASLRALLRERGIHRGHEILTRLESAGLHCVAVAYFPRQLYELAAELHGKEVPLAGQVESMTPLVPEDDRA